MVFEENVMFLTQSTHCKRTLKQIGMEMAGCAPTPMVNNIYNLVLNADPSKYECSKAKELSSLHLIASSLYPSCYTRLDILFSVASFCTLVVNATMVHCSTLKLSPLYPCDYLDCIMVDNASHVYQTPNRDAYSSHSYRDSGWAGYIQSRKSTCGYAVLLYGGLVTWRLYKQCCGASSSLESEYNPLLECDQESVVIVLFYKSWVTGGTGCCL